MDRHPGLQPLRNLCRTAGPQPGLRAKHQFGTALGDNPDQFCGLGSIAAVKCDFCREQPTDARSAVIVAHNIGQFGGPDRRRLGLTQARACQGRCIEDAGLP